MAKSNDDQISPKVIVHFIETQKREHSKEIQSLEEKVRYLQGQLTFHLCRISELRLQNDWLEQGLQVIFQSMDDAEREANIPL
jgi:Na+/phosphate symporter